MEGAQDFFKSQVLPGLFIGDAASARNVRFLQVTRIGSSLSSPYFLFFLQKIGIKAVLNTAEGPWSEWGFVDLSPSHYQGSGIHYQVTPLLLLLISVDFLEDILTRVSAYGTHREPPLSRTLDPQQITWTLSCQRQEERSGIEMRRGLTGDWWAIENVKI